ncbi:MAG: HAMP domain-containing sensor histidine kinase [Kofleriaceae bacterium]
MQSPPVHDGRSVTCQQRSVCDCGCAESLAARDEFIGVLGHELRNSLAPLVLLTDHFEQMSLAHAPQLEARVAMLTRNLKKLSTTIDRITEVSAIRNGQIDLDYELVDLRDVVDDVVREHGDEVKRAGATLSVNYGRAVQGWWDRARLKQVVGNLVGNAIRYGDGCAISISTTIHGATAELSVSDEGPGIPLAQREFVFDRFEHRTENREGGFGVGLFVVKALCNAMGGTVRLDSNPRGARFCIKLPRG